MRFPHFGGIVMLSDNMKTAGLAVFFCARVDFPSKSK